MHFILEFVVTHMRFLWTDARFKIVDSDVRRSNGGDAVLLLESSVLRMRIVCDRRELMLDLQPVAETKEWFSLDLVRRMFTGQPEPSALLDASYAEFLDLRMTELETRCSEDNWASTLAELRALKKKRSKEMFG